MSGGTHRRAFRPSDHKRKAAAWALVIALHVVLGWALVSGTARQEPAFVNQPLQAAFIQEVVIPPPPPPPPAPEPERIEPPRPRPAERAPAARAVPPPRRAAPAPAPVPAVPAPDRALAAEPAAPETAAAPVPASEPAAAAPAPAAAAAPSGADMASATSPAQAAAARPASPGPAEMTVACPHQVTPQMPSRAVREGTQGVVEAQAVIRDGVVREVTILSGPPVYHAAVRQAMLQYRCVSGSGEVVATQKFVFKIE